MSSEFENIPSHYDCIKMLRNSMLGLYKHATQTLKQRYNINIYTNLINDTLSGALIVPDEVFDSLSTRKRIEHAIYSIFKKFHFKVINNSWKTSDMYNNSISYVIASHYYFEVVPYYNINYSEVYQKDYIFEEHPTWFLKEIRMDSHTVYVYATQIVPDEMD